MSAVVINRKTQIYETAKTLFQERGYAATSMRDLANEVGIEAASLYNHIKSKEEILQNICFEMAEAFFDALKPVIVSNASPESKLQQAITNHIAVIALHLDASSVFFKEWRFLTGTSLKKFKRLRKKYEHLFTGILEEGVKQKIFKDIDLKIAVFTIFSALNATYDIYNPKIKTSSSEIAQQIGNIILDGLRYNPESRMALEHFN